METASSQSNRLRKGVLKTGDAIAQSIALLALVMAIALSTSFAAQFAGAAAPLAFVVAGLGSLCLAYVIIRFTRRMASAGSIYTYVSQGLGPAAGFIGGWLYAGAFTIGIAFTTAIASIYLQGVLANIGVKVDWFVLFCGLLIVLFLFAFFDIRIATRVQLILAALGILSVLVLAVIILAKGGNAGLSWVPFSPAATWASDQTVLDTLAKRYANAALATFIDVMVSIDAFVASLATLNLVARVFYAMGRERSLPSAFGWTHPRYKSPWVGIVVALVVPFLLGVTIGRSLGPFNFFGFFATIGSLGILAAYILVAIAGMVFFLRSQQDTGLMLLADIILPVIALLLCGATIYSTIIPVPPPPLNLAPYLVAVWLLLGLILLAVLWFTNREQMLRFGSTLGE